MIQHKTEQFDLRLYKGDGEHSLWQRMLRFMEILQNRTGWRWIVPREICKK